MWYFISIFQIWSVSFNIVPNFNFPLFRLPQKCGLLTLSKGQQGDVNSWCCRDILNLWLFVKQLKKVGIQTCMRKINVYFASSQCSILHHCLNSSASQHALHACHFTLALADPIVFCRHYVCLKNPGSD